MDTTPQTNQQPQTKNPENIKYNCCKPALFTLAGIFLTLLILTTIAISWVFSFRGSGVKDQPLTPKVEAPAGSPQNTQSVKEPENKEPIEKWLTYTSPSEQEFDFLSSLPFELNYPVTWAMAEKIQKGENPYDPDHFTLRLSLDQEFIEIEVGTGGGGNCVYSDDKDYLTYEGAGNTFPEYTQINQTVKWRLSAFQDKKAPARDYSHTLCEITKNGRYVDMTRIGWVYANVSSPITLSTVTKILESVKFKAVPSPDNVFWE